MTATVASRRAVLHGAARILEQVGWTQGTPTDINGRVCARQAIFLAADGDRAAAVTALQDTARFLEPLKQDLVEWNDLPGRRQEHAVALLRTVAGRVAA